MEFVPILAFGLLTTKVTGFVKSVTSADWQAAVTQLVAWAVGVLAMFVFAEAALTNKIPVGDQILASLDGWSKLLAGLVVGSTGSFLFDAKKALDGSDSAVEAPLFGGKLNGGSNVE